MFQNTQVCFNVLHMSLDLDFQIGWYGELFFISLHWDFVSKYLGLNAADESKKTLVTCCGWRQEVTDTQW